MKKRNLIVALSGMGALAVAVGAVGTAAWYSASNATVSKIQAVTGTLNTEASALDVDTYRIVPTWGSLTPATVALSDNTGASFAVQNGVLVAAHGTTEGYADLTWAVYAGGEGTTAATVDQLKSIAGAYTFTVSSNQARVRLSALQANVYSVGYSSTVTITFTIAADGTYSADINKVWYSVGGGATDGAATAGSTAVAEETGSITGTITIAGA